MKTLIVLLLFSLSAFAVKHRMTFYLMISSGVPNVPEYVAVAEIDGVMAAYYDNNMEAPEPRQEWYRDLMEDDPQQWERNARDCMRYQQLFKDQTDSFKLSSDQTEGADIKQQVWGCEWDSETQKVAGHQKYGYKGEDFLIYNLKTDTWIAANQQAKVTKQEWDGNKASNAIWKNFIVNVCPVWLKTFLKYGKNVLLRKVAAVVLVAAAAAAGFTVYKKKKEKRPENTPENITELSERLNAQSSDEKTSRLVHQE